MSDIDTRAEAVERLAQRHDLVPSTWRMQSSDHLLTAATLRALLAERDRLREACVQLLEVMPVLPAAAKSVVGMEERYNDAIRRARAALWEDRP